MVFFDGLYPAGGNSRGDTAGGNISGNDRPRRDDAVGTDANAWHQDGVCANEYILFNSDWSKGIEIRIFSSKYPNAAVMGDKTDSGSNGDVMANPDQKWFRPERGTGNPNEAAIGPYGNPKPAGVPDWISAGPIGSGESFNQTRDHRGVLAAQRCIGWNFLKAETMQEANQAAENPSARQIPHAMPVEP